MTSPFDWKGKPSIFANDRHFRANSKGMTLSQQATKVVDRMYAKGVNHGTMVGISKTQDLALTTETFRRMHLKGAQK